MLPDNTAVQAAFDAIDANFSDDWLTKTIIKGLIVGYDARWREATEKLTLKSVEETWHAPLVNVSTSRESRTFTLAGKLDKLVDDDGSVVLFDHKTTSSDISDPAGTYWQQITIEGQPLHYEILLKSNGINPRKIVWDVVKKPGIRPKKITKATRTSIMANGTYCGRRISDDTRYIQLTDDRENPELFQARLIAEVIENPDKYYARRSVPRTNQELVDYAQSIWDIADDMRLSQNKIKETGRLPVCNSGACMNYGTPCTFLGICSNHDTPDSDKWQRKGCVHSELDDLAGDGRDVITNSRVRVFQTCNRLHYYKYILGIERADGETKASLYFGNQWHLALDAYWIALCKPERETHVNCNDAPASCAGNSSSQTKLAQGNQDGF